MRQLHLHQTGRDLRHAAPVAKYAATMLLLLCILLIVNPPPADFEMPPARDVETTNAKIGVHTRLTDEVEEEKISLTMSMVREMGAPWIVEYFPWAYIEPLPGQYSWEHSDMVVAYAENHGVRVIARLGLVPAWARRLEGEDETSPTYLPETGYARFARFASIFADRYRDVVQEIVLWNEPNLSFEWGYRPVDPAGYADLLRVVYPMVRQANPDVVVLAGALAPTLEPKGSPAGLNDLIYLQEMYEAGASPFFDALAAHAYGLGFAPEVAPDAGLINFRRVELLRSIMDRNGDDGKLIYVTESGWNDHPRWTWSVLPSQRIRYTLDAYSWADEHWPWCPVVAMWMFRTPAPLHNYQDYYAFVTPDFTARPIYAAVQAYARRSP